MRTNRGTLGLALALALLALPGGTASAQTPKCTVVLKANAPAATINRELAKPSFTVVCLRRGTRKPEQAGEPGLVISAAGGSAFNYLEAKPKSHVAIEGGVKFAEGAGHIVLNGFHITGAVQVLGASNIVIERNELLQRPTTATSAEAGIFCSDCTDVGVHLNTFHGFHNAPGEEREGKLISGGGGDPVRFQGTTTSSYITSNEFYANTSIAGGPSPDRNACIQVSQGTLVGHLEINHNYFHDNDCQGPVIQSEMPNSVGGKVIYDNNLMVRDSTTACQGTGSTCQAGEVNLFINDPYLPFEAVRDTEIENEGGAVIGPYDREQPVRVGHSLFDLLQRAPWCTGEEVEEPAGTHESRCTTGEFASIEPYTSSEWNYLKNTASQWVEGEHEQPESGQFSYPEFKCGVNCGEGHTAANDDYRIAFNPNGIGIDWAPAELRPGPER